MIEQNKYTDETIHVANWLLLSGNVDLEELRANAEQEVEKLRKSPDWDEAEYEEFFDDFFLEQVEDAINIAIMDAIPDSDYQDCTVGYDFPGSAESYQGASLAVLVTSLLSAAFRNVNMTGVANLVLSHLPALAAA